MSLRDELVRLFPELATMPCDVYVVGGAVRDLLRGETPADIDVASDDPLLCARALKRKIIRLGREHLSAWRVAGGTHIYDFAELLDHDILADLARRDFTIDAMAVHIPSGELFDPHGGQRDLKLRLVRMVDPKNFDDDPLRMLKAVRMAVGFGFDIDSDTSEAIRARARKILTVAAERVSYELNAIFSSGSFHRAAALLRDTGLDVPLFERELEPQKQASLPLAAAFAVVLRNPRDFAERWKWSGAMLREVETLQRLAAMEGDLRVALYDAGAGIASQLQPLLRALGRDDRVTMPDFALQPLLSGDDIARLTGLRPGPQLGALKRTLLEKQIRGEIGNVAEAERFVAAEAAV